MNKKKPNILFFGMESLRADHMSLYGYNRLTTPHMDNYLKDALVFNNCLSPSIPTTPGYSSMLTGMDCFSTTVVALRHQGTLPDDITTLPELLKQNGYNTTCVGFRGNAASRGFDKYIDFEGWGNWDKGPLLKAENLNNVTVPELKRLSAEDKPFFLFLRHMEPHSPYIPPKPFDRMFYSGNEFDENNTSLQDLYNFKPFRDYFLTWFPPGCTDAEYIVSQYDGEIAYMDACIQVLLNELNTLGIEDDTIVVFTSDHGETLTDHRCYFDHHSMYDNCLHVPLAIKYNGAKGRFDDIVQVKDIMPTLLALCEIETDIKFDGRNLTDLAEGRYFRQEPDVYITEATWMRKHGIRTPEWKLIVSLEPDFHFFPEVELYNLIKDPKENSNVADENTELVAYLKHILDTYVERRTGETGRPAPIYTNTNWSGHGRPFNSSEEAYNTLHIGDPDAAKKLQADLNKMGIKA